VPWVDLCEAGLLEALLRLQWRNEGNCRVTSLENEKIKAKLFERQRTQTSLRIIKKPTANGIAKGF